MMTSHDDHRMQRFLLDLYTLQDTRSLSRKLCETLATIIPGDNVFVGRHDMRADRIINSAVTHLFGARDFMPRVNDYCQLHPLWEPIRRGKQTVRVLSDYATRDQWQNNPLHVELLAVDQVQDHISVEFGSRSGLLTSVGVFRSKRGFTKAERERLALLTPHIELALINARIAESSGIVGPNGRLARNHAILRMSPDGRFEQFSPIADEIFGRFGLAGRRNALPVELARWLARARHLLNQGLLESKLDPYYLRSEHEIAEFRLYSVGDQPGYWLAMHLTNQSDHLPRDRLATKLTTREHEILGWIRAGKTNEGIAATLGLSVHTVKTHLKRIYTKLGVGNRTEAALLLQGNGADHPPF